jgi:Rod binding domain-containing protein
MFANPIPPTTAHTGAAPRPHDFSGSDKATWKAAQALESSFLAEMLKAAGFGETRETFGGGAGEEQFSSFLREAQAREMVRAGGIGLAEQFFNALKEHDDG